MAAKKKILDEPIVEEHVITFPEPEDLPVITTFGLNRIQDGKWQYVKLESKGGKVIKEEYGDVLHRGNALNELKVAIIKKWGLSVE